MTVTRKAVILKRMSHIQTVRKTSALSFGTDDIVSRAERKEALEIRPLDLVRTCKELALDKKGEDLVVLDLRGLSSVTDYFVVCHGASRRHVQAIAENVRFGMRKLSVPEAHMEGFPEGRWVVLDYIDAIVHVFDEEMRTTYQLEELWGEAARIE